MSMDMFSLPGTSYIWKKSEIKYSLVWIFGEFYDLKTIILLSSQPGVVFH